MKMIEFFIERKIIVDGAGHSIIKRRVVKPLNASNRTRTQKFRKNYMSYTALAAPVSFGSAVILSIILSAEA
jgi:hypothetical protein